MVIFMQEGMKIEFKNVQSNETSFLFADAVNMISVSIKEIHILWLGLQKLQTSFRLTWNFI